MAHCRRCGRTTRLTAKKFVCRRCPPITGDDIKAAWQKCQDLWEAAGKPLPCHEENYMTARAEYSRLLGRGYVA